MARLRLIHRTIPYVVIVLLFICGSYVALIALAPSLMELPPFRQTAYESVRDELREAVSRRNKLYIPSIGVSIDVVTGTDESALLRGAWHRKPENGNPRDGGNFVLSAHRFDMGLTPQGTVKKSPFYHIHKLRRGDKITVDYDGMRYTYKVTKNYRVDPDEVSIERRTDSAKMTLYSCTLRGSADGREVVEAVPITQ